MGDRKRAALLKRSGIRELHLVWNGTEWTDDRCGCRYHPDDQNMSHGGAPHVHQCEAHRVAHHDRITRAALERARDATCEPCKGGNVPDELDRHWEGPGELVRGHLCRANPIRALLAEMEGTDHGG